MNPQVITSVATRVSLKHLLVCFLQVHYVGDCDDGTVIYENVASLADSELHWTSEHILQLNIFLIRLQLLRFSLSLLYISNNVMYTIQLKK